MTIVEAGVIAGMPAGATIGGIVCRSYGTGALVGGLAVGLVSGALAGWLYAFVIIFLISVVGVLWRAARKRVEKIPTEADVDLMQPVANRGVILGILSALGMFISFGWLPGVLMALTAAGVTAFVAVARCQLR
jgi:predicted MFS family arabinose efflux permease